MKKISLNHENFVGTIRNYKYMCVMTELRQEGENGKKKSMNNRNGLIASMSRRNKIVEN
jgi:hypothetical protein